MYLLTLIGRLDFQMPYMYSYFKKKSKTQLLFSIFRLRAFFETLPNDKQPGFLCPDYAGFLGITEKHFYESLSSVLDTNVDCRYCRG